MSSSAAWRNGWNRKREEPGIFRDCHGKPGSSFDVELGDTRLSPVRVGPCGVKILELHAPNRSASFHFRFDLHDCVFLVLPQGLQFRVAMVAINAAHRGTTKIGAGLTAPASVAGSGFRLDLHDAISSFGLKTSGCGRRLVDLTAAERGHCSWLAAPGGAASLDLRFDLHRFLLTVRLSLDACIDCTLLAKLPGHREQIANY